MARHWTLTLAILMCGITLIAQNSEQTADFKPSGKVDGRVWANFYTTVNGPTNASAFEIKRAYWGYTYNLAPEWSARVLLDIGEKDGLNRYAFFKNAALFYTKENWKVGFGMQDTYNMKTQERIWGKRYIDKSYLDHFGFAHTADLGITALYTYDNLVFDAGLFNGEGFKTVQKDNTYRLSVGATASLLDNKLVLRIGDEYERRIVAQNTLTLFAGYVSEPFSGGIEYNQQTNYTRIDGVDRGGISIFATAALTGKSSIFGRYEEIETSGTSYANDGARYILGFEHKVLKNLRGSINLQGVNPDNSDDYLNAFFNIEVVF